jgi:hypothetical protein
MQPNRPLRVVISSLRYFPTFLRPSVFIHLRTIASVNPFPAHVYQNTRVWGYSRRYFVSATPGIGSKRPYGAGTSSTGSPACAHFRERVAGRSRGDSSKIAQRGVRTDSATATAASSPAKRPLLAYNLFFIRCALIRRTFVGKESP